MLDLHYNRSGRGEGLVHWVGMPSCEDSWEDVQKLPQQLPSLHLEDKVKDLGGSIVRGTLVKNACVRRSREGQEALGPGTQEGQLTKAVREEERK